jgi:Kdo2-lipid IVA lauroyltransferase/acyltransferase
MTPDGNGGTSLLAYLEYLLVKACGLIINALPEKMALGLGRRFGQAAFHLDRGHRETALQNLQDALGQEKNQEERLRIARAVFENLGLMAVEFFRLPRMSMESFRERVRMEGFGHVEAALRKGKGALLLLGHFGNWEMMGMVSKRLEHPILVIARPIKKNPRLDGMVNGIRASAGLEVVPAEKASRPILRALAGNRLVGILIDQRAKRSEGVPAEFFGRKAPTTPALAVLALRTGSPVLPVFMVREKDGFHRIIIQSPVELIRSGDVQKDVEENTRRMNGVLEGMVRQFPDQWFWVHQRWARKKADRAGRLRELKESGDLEGIRKMRERGKRS